MKAPSLSKLAFQATTKGILSLGLLALPWTQAAKAADYTWIGSGATASWNVADNWSKSSPFTGFPNSDGAFVLISKPSLGANQTINLNQTISIGRLDIGNTITGSIARRYTIAAGTGGVLNLTSYNSGNAQINEVADAVAGDIITAPITLSASLDISNPSGFTINLIGGITSATAGAKSINLLTGKAKITDVGNGAGTVAITHSSNGLLTLGGANTYSGNTAVNSGTLLLESGASMTFYIGDNQVSNAITGTGTVTLEGTFVFNLSGAVAADGNSWQIVQAGTLTETFGTTFAVQGFTETTAGVWSQSGYTFTEATGLLTYAVPEPQTWALLMLLPALLIMNRRKKQAPALKLFV